MAGGSSFDGPPPCVTRRRRPAIRTIAVAIRRYFHATPGRRFAFRIFVGIAGLILVASGLLLVPLPGPGWLIVFSGVALWAVEFEWARRLLRHARARLRGWREWLNRRSWRVRVPAAVGVAIAAGATIWLVMRYGFDIDPFERIFGAETAAPFDVDAIR